MRALAFFIGLWCAIAFAQPIPSPVLYTKPGSSPPLTVSCPGTGATSSTISCSGTYTGTAPSSITSAVWQSPLSGSVTPPSVTFTGGNWGPANFPTPAAGGTGKLLITTNLSTTALSSNVAIGDPNCVSAGAWVCLAHAQGLSTDNVSAATGPMNCTGANLEVVTVAFFGGIGSFSSLVDSTGLNTWGTFSFGSSGGGSNASMTWFLVNPAVSSSQTFTVTGTGTFVPVIEVQCWHDTVGTPTNDGGGDNNGTTSSISSITAGAFAITPTVSGDLIYTTITSHSTVVVYTVNSGFTVFDQTPDNGATHVGAAVASLVYPSIVPINPTWGLSPADAGGAGTALFGFKP